MKIMIICKNRLMDNILYLTGRHDFYTAGFISTFLYEPVAGVFIKRILYQKADLPGKRVVLTSFMVSRCNTLRKGSGIPDKS
jgi:hypothetical protein